MQKSPVLLAQEVYGITEPKVLEFLGLVETYSQNRLPPKAIEVLKERSSPDDLLANPQIGICLLGTNLCEKDVVKIEEIYSNSGFTWLCFEEALKLPVGNQNTSFSTNLAKAVYHIADYYGGLEFDFSECSQLTAREDTRYHGFELMSLMCGRNEEFRKLVVPFATGVISTNRLYENWNDRTGAGKILLQAVRFSNTDAIFDQLTDAAITDPIFKVRYRLLERLWAERPHYELAGNSTRVAQIKNTAIKMAKFDEHDGNKNFANSLLDNVGLRIKSQPEIDLDHEIGRRLSAWQASLPMAVP